MDWNVAALLGSAILTSCLRRNLCDVPLPSNLSEDEDAHREQLDEFARPIEDSAIGAYEYAIKEARRNVIMNEWTVKIQTSLNKYKAEEYPLFKSEVRPDALLHTSNPFHFPVEAKTDADSKENEKETEAGSSNKTASADENSETDSSSSSDGVEPCQSGKANSGPQRDDFVVDDETGQTHHINRRRTALRDNACSSGHYLWLWWSRSQRQRTPQVR